jgi:hypothetical protein
MANIPNVILEAISQYNSYDMKGYYSNCLYVEVPILNRTETVEMGFGFHDERWLLYSCTENLPEGWWEGIQKYLIEKQPRENLE